MLWFIPLIIGLAINDIYPIYEKYETYNIIYFCGITFIFHTLTDFLTSKLNTKLWNKVEQNKELLDNDNEGYNVEYFKEKIGKSIHNFFVSIGFDQYLHYIQIFLTYYILFKK